MLENTVDSLIKRIKEEVITDPNMKDIPLAYLLTRNIPDSVKHFFDQEVELWIREEEEKFSSNERFDYDMPEVRMLIDKIFDHLKQHANFHITKFNQLLERAVKLEMNYLLTPQRTLTQFIFKDSAIVSTMEVYDTLKYFFRFEYYKNAISDYFNQKYLKEVSQDQFRELIAQIDEKVFSEDRFETTLKTIKAITSYISEATGAEVESLQVDVLKQIFDDRHLDSYSNLMEDLLKIGDEEVSLTTLETILKEEKIDIAPAAAETGADETIIASIDTIEESKPSVEVDEIDVGDMIFEKPEEEAEEEEEFEEEEEIEEAEVAEAPAAEVTEEAPAPGKVANELADFVAGQISSDAPLADLNEMIAGRLRRKIIKKLFKKNENDFVSFVNELNNHGSWKTASVAMDDAFYERGINPYSKEAIAFSDLVYTRFFPKDKYVGERSPDEKFD